MQKYFDKMLEDMELRNLAPNTIKAYLRCVQVFLRNIHKEANEVDIEDIRNYILYLKQDKKLCFGTINAYVSALKFFYDITLEKGWDSRRVPRMRGYKSLPVVLSKDEVLKVIASITNLKHKAILMTIYSSGLRVSEVAHLKVSDIDSKNMQIFIRQSKNKSDRYAILSQTNLELLRTYWLKSGKPKDWLFPGSEPGKPIHTKTIKNLVLKVKARLGISKKISAHTFRHCFATHLLENGVQLTHIQHLMGHKSFRSTTKYLHMTSKAMMKIKSPLDHEEGDLNA